MFDFWDTPAGAIAKRRALLSEGKVWIDTFRNDTQFRKWVLDLIRQDQLFEKGIDSEGDVIGFYSFSTAQSNPSKRFNTHYTLKDTGRLYASMFLVVTADYFEVRWDDEKIRDQEWWSDKILGFTDESIEKISKAYTERLLEYAERLLFEDI
jgi:hypothetical protein